MGMDVDKAIFELGGFVGSICRSSSKDPGTQDDLYQEAMITVVNVVLKYGDRPLEEFIKVAKQSVRNRVTSEARLRRAYTKYTDLAAKPDRDESRHEESVCAKEAFQFIRERLAAHDREVFDLLAKDLSAADIQRMTGRGKTSVWRSMKNIGDVVDRKGWEDIFRPIDRFLAEEKRADVKRK